MDKGKVYTLVNPDVSPRTEIGIVYFVYLNPQKEWQKFIQGQLKDVRQSGILTDATLYVVVSNPFGIAESEIIKFLSMPELQVSEFELHTENKYEYYGIHRLWELGRSAAHPYLIYFHTKGMSYKNKYPFKIFNNRCIREIILTHYLFRNYQATLNLFKNGVCSRAGFVCRNSEPAASIPWFNFFWISAEYIKNLEEPKDGTGRFYYEIWTSLVNRDQVEVESVKIRSEFPPCYSLYSKSFASSSIEEASNLLARIRKIYKYTFPFSYLWFKLTIKSKKSHKTAS